MVKTNAASPLSKGICSFCKTEITKNKMTQHLKFCKQRLATLAKQEEAAQEEKTLLFHILAEGKYNPQYWLHFELPASKSLWSIDGFLKDMWIDDLDHLSGFNINDKNYSMDRSPYDFSFSEEKTDELDENDIKEIVDRTIAAFSIIPLSPQQEIQSSPETLSLQDEWIEELKQPRSVDDMIDYLTQEQRRVKKEIKEEIKLLNNDRRNSSQMERKRYFLLNDQKLMISSLLEELEDNSMGAALKKVLKVGQKFSYIYDYGTSTRINLKVIAEREGIVSTMKGQVQLLAQNTPPAFLCAKCGKPATKILVNSYSMEDDVFCTSCAKKETDEYQLLPLTNSPRTGVL